MTAIQECTIDLQVATAHFEALVEAELDILRADLQLPEYIEQLKGLYGFYEPAEKAIALSGLPWYFADWHPLLRTSWLEADLAYFDVPIARLPLDEAIPYSLSSAQAFGWQYAVEELSSMGLGVQRYLAPKLCLSPESGLCFYSGAQGKSMDRRAGFEEALGAFCAAHPEARDSIVQSAKIAFAALVAWLRRNNVSQRQPALSLAR